MVTEARESAILIEKAFDVANALECQSILVCSYNKSDIKRVRKELGAKRVIWIMDSAPIDEIEVDDKNLIVTVPSSGLDRMSQLRVAFLQSVILGHIKLEETIVCLTGMAGSSHIDNLLITNAKRDFPWFKQYDEDNLPALGKSKVFVKLLDIALHLAIEGREGKPIGTILVLGSKNELKDCLKQLILNPCQGHGEKERNIFTPGILESVREFSAMDGAIVFNRKGLIQSAGTYLNTTSSNPSHKMPSGLGARHQAALALTIHTNAVTIAISESSGKVTVYYQGKDIITLDKM